MKTPGKLTQFYLNRITDINGCSGEGIIAQGVILPSGRVVMEWVTEHQSIAIYDSIDEIQLLHAHKDTTFLVYL